MSYSQPNNYYYPVQVSQQQLTQQSMLNMPQQTYQTPNQLTQLPAFSYSQPVALLQPETQFPITYSNNPPANNWQTVPNKKRNRSPDRNLAQNKKSQYWLGTPTSNSFEPLQMEDAQTDGENQPTLKVAQPPPIFIAEVKSIKPLTTLLDEIAKDNFTLKALGNEQVKIQSATSVIYSTIIKALTQKNTQFHTYKPKQKKNFKVVIKNLHHSTDTNEIKQNLEILGHNVANVWNIKHKFSKNSIPMFIVELKQKENNKEIYNTKLFMNTSVVIEAPHAKRVVPQCTKCQRFGHTKNYCQHTPRCVKCTQYHQTIDCPRKIKDDKVACVNCNGNHPANYRGCIIHKQLQEKLYPRLRNDIGLLPPRKSFAQSEVSPGTSFAAKVNPQTFSTTYNMPETTNFQSQIFQPYQQTQAISELNNMIKNLVTQMRTIMNLLTTLITKLS